MAEPAFQLRGTIDGADCASCPFARQGKPDRPVVGVGPDDPSWILIGEGPGASEQQWGLPFVGATGAIVNRMLQETGIPRGRLWIGNVTLCKPNVPGEAARELAASACRGRLKKELAMFPGKPILAAGGVATRELLLGATNLKKITDLTGTYHEHDIDGTGVRGIIPTVHPAAMLRSMGGEARGEKTGGHTSDVGYWALKFDALKVNSLAQGKDIRLKVDELTDFEIEDAKHANQLFREIVKEIYEDKLCGIDLETTVEDEQRNTALQGWAARIVLLGIASKRRSVSLAWSLLDAGSINTLRAILSSQIIVKVFHNLAYDTAVLQNPYYRFQIVTSWAKMPLLEDTMLADHAAFPGAPHNLQAMACRYRAIPPWKAEYRDGDDTPEEAAKYNATDILTTVKSLAPVHMWIKKTGTEQVYEVDRKMAALAAKMHLWGFHVDRDVNQVMQEKLGAAIEKQREFLHGEYEKDKDRVLHQLAFEYAKTQRKADPLDFKERWEVRRAELQKEIDKGRWQFSPSNDNQMVALFKSKGVPLIKMTPGGKTSTSADALEVVSHHPIVNALLRYRDNETVFETFVYRMFEWKMNSQKKWVPPFVQDDGRVHPIWSVNKISGRWGSEKPGAQNWPEGDESNDDVYRWLPNIRRQVTAPLGRIFVAFDYEQLEARLMALQSGDPFLCRIFSEGLDIHAEVAKVLFPQFAALDPSSPEYHRLRTITKRFEYGALYGGSDETVWKSVVIDEPSITRQAVSAAIAKIKSLVSGLLAWQARLLRETSQPPYTLRSYILKRMRVFPLGNPPATDVNNNPNQFAGADVMNLGICNMLPRLEKYRRRGVETCFPIKNVHDAMYFECAEADAMRVAKDIQEAFPQTYRSASGVQIDFPIEVKIGYALHSEPKDKDKAKHPQLIWPVGRPGLQKVKVAA